MKLFSELAEPTRLILPATSRSLEERATSKDAERFVDKVRRDDPELAQTLRIEERELEAGGLN